MPDLTPVQQTTVTPKFSSKAPLWFSDQRWNWFGLAVPRIQKSKMYSVNICILKFVEFVQMQMFRALWIYPDRKFLRSPNIGPIWEIYQAIVVGRQHLRDNITQDDVKRFDPSNARPAPQMFNVWPVPYFGDHGCTMPEFKEWTEYMFLMLVEAMAHDDNAIAFDVSQSFYERVYPYMGRVLRLMGTQFFGFDKVTASDPSFVIPASSWQQSDRTKPANDPANALKYNPDAYRMSFQGIEVRDPVGTDPTDDDLAPIKAIPIIDALKFVKEWPLGDVVAEQIETGPYKTSDQSTAGLQAGSIPGTPSGAAAGVLLTPNAGPATAT